MPLTNYVVDRLIELGVAAEVVGREITVTVDNVTSRLRFEETSEEKFQNFRRARRSAFDVFDRSYALNSTIEVPLTRLDPDVFRDSDEMSFSDERGNTVCIQRASFEYALAHFSSTDYETYFADTVKLRLTRARVNFARSVNTLLRSPVTATFIPRSKRANPNLKALAIERIRSCLTKLAIERHACYEIFKPTAGRSIATLDSVQTSDGIIPRVVYEPNLVSYYKVARSSPFPSQSFLSYYHVLEYYFLRVTEDALHYQLRTQLNRADFKANSDGLDRVISLIRRHGSTDDETEMLRKVLQRFIPEDEFISYVTSLEERAGEKLYSKRRVIFGEALEISLKEGHALSNAAKILKHVRNAIVHSSDRYKREECHIPLTESEGTIGGFIPIVKYFAEQVIYGTAAPSEF
jgi:hypothetical protein